MKIINRDFKLRKFHQAQWNEPIIFELSTKGERGVFPPRASKEIEDIVGNGIDVVDSSMLRKEEVNLPEVAQHRVLRHYLRLSQETLGADLNNLLKSFAGESQARNRYTYYASIAKKQGFVQMSNIFIETADNEKEHAKRFYKFLKEDFKDEPIEITATYPVSFHAETVDNLKAAAAGENEEWSELYPEFAKIAREEGFEEIAIVYEMIAKAEKRHETRFLKLVENIENGTVFKKDEKVLWKLQNSNSLTIHPVLM